MNMLLTLLVLLKVDYSVKEPVVYFDRIQINELYQADGTCNHRIDQIIFEDFVTVLAPTIKDPTLHRPVKRFMVEHWLMMGDDARDMEDVEHKAKWEKLRDHYLSALPLQERAMVFSKYKYPGKYNPDNALQPVKTSDGFYTVRIPRGWRSPSTVDESVGHPLATALVVKAKIIIHTRTTYDPEVDSRNMYKGYERRLFSKPKKGKHIWQR